MKKRIYLGLFKDITLYFLTTLFTLSLIIWLLQAVNYLDIVSEDGHGILTYFKFSIFNYPKILSKTFLLSFFLALYYVLNLYEEKNQLLIYWSNGISKINFLKKLLAISSSFVLISLFLSLFLAPYSQDKARSFIRSSNVDFFPSLIKEKTFVDTVENLTIFLESKEKNLIKKIVIKDASNDNNVQFIIAKEGIIFNDVEKKSLNLFNGKIINKNKNGKTTIFNFEESVLDLDKYTTKTTTSAKIQELSTLSILRCVINIKKNNYIRFENFNCSEGFYSKLVQELYKRSYLPLFIYLITIITAFIILNSNAKPNYKIFNLRVFLISIFFIVFSEVSVSMISKVNLVNLAIILVLPALLILSYYFFNNKSKTSH